mmetsp:Transcript_67204/g.216825  ORF Transcript_67204/g.216825 Transcript_67204/m.216825 type:complete len:256 (-) Transcript_67204:550-1317(-)
MGMGRETRRDAWSPMKQSFHMSSLEPMMLAAPRNAQWMVHRASARLYSGDTLTADSRKSMRTVRRACSCTVMEERALATAFSRALLRMPDTNSLAASFCACSRSDSSATLIHPDACSTVRITARVSCRASCQDCAFRWATSSLALGFTKLRPDRGALCSGGRGFAGATGTRGALALSCTGAAAFGALSTGRTASSTFGTLGAGGAGGAGSWLFSASLALYLLSCSNMYRNGSSGCSRSTSWMRLWMRCCRWCWSM